MANVFSLGGGSGLASGGSGKGLYYVELPRSRYYEDVAEWVTTATIDGMADPSLQVVCNGELWCVSQSGIYARSLATKEITYSESGTYFLYGVNSKTICGIATDGESRIWFTSWNVNTSSNVTSSNHYLSLYEYNILTHTKHSSTIMSNTQSYNSSSAAPGIIMYSSKYNRVYYLGGYLYRNGQSHYANGYMNCDDYTLTSLGNTLWGNATSYALSNCYTYEDEEGYLYFGDGITGTSNTGNNGAYNYYIYRLNPYNNSVTTVRTNFDDQIKSTSPNVLYINVGNMVYIMSPTNVYAIDPTTGDFLTGEMPAVLGLNISGASSKKAFYNNTFYIWVNNGDQTMVECTFYHESPPKAPVVAKIYKGQKYHALVPFSLLRQGIEVTTQQQEATEDIEIKMYDYSSEGGQLLYIETT